MINVPQRNQHASDMRQILKSFMEQHPHDFKMDDFSQKETAIIHTLYRRAQEIEERRARAARPSLKENISAERTQTKSTSSPRGSLDASMPAPPLPIKADGVGSGTNTPIRSPVSMFVSRESPFNGQNITPPGMGSSPEEDQPQKLYVDAAL
jgi:hypothetical protein